MPEPNRWAGRARHSASRSGPDDDFAMAPAISRIEAFRSAPSTADAIHRPDQIEAIVFAHSPLRPA